MMSNTNSTASKNSLASTNSRSSTNSAHSTDGMDSMSVANMTLASTSSGSTKAESFDDSNFTKCSVAQEFAKGLH